MTATRPLALFLTLAAAGALLNASGPAAGAAPAGSVRLKSVTSRVHAKGASVVIEASEPAAYIATAPDPLTLLVEFRNAVSDGVANSFSANPKSPIKSVVVEPSDWLGSPASRVRVVLTQAVAHHVRSDRNVVVVDFDKPVAKASSSASRPGGTSGAAPDAMKALDSAPERPTVDLMSALGLGAGTPAPAAARAQVAASTTITPSAPQPPSPPVLGTGQPNERRYTGNPVSLDFQGADLRAVLRTFAEISGLNMVIDPRVNGTVDVALRDVPWDQALDIILRANSLGYIVDGTIVRIAPLDALEAEQKKMSDLSKAQAEAGQITTLTRQLSYAKGEDIAALLKAAGILSARGTAFVDARTNTLIISDLAERLTSTTQLINTLDTAQPQVEIEARIVNINKNYARALGVQWGFTGRVDPALGNTAPLAFPNNGSLTGRTGGLQAQATGQPTAVNLGVGGAPSAVGLALGSVNGAFGLDVALSALESSGNGRILSTPRVTTQNNVAAEIAQGVKIPVTTTANNTTTTTFVDAALTLRVTPQITSAGTVIMQIQVDNGSVGDVTPEGKLSINTQRAATTLLVGDGQTTVIGGIFSSTNTTTNDRTPGLGSIPLLKWLFKRDSLSDKSTELLIFITPRIIKS